ncbi:MAG: response regulator [Bacteroidota bacterium]|nr:response regulator [Bacteroidota bacterium]
MNKNKNWMPDSKKTKAELLEEISRMREALDKCYNQLHILSKGNNELISESSQNLYYNIANLAVKSINLEQLFYDIHTLLKKVIDVNNFIIALYDNKNEYIHFPYYVDEHFEGVVQTMKRKISHGLTEYNLFKGVPLFLYEEEIVGLINEKKVSLTGRIPKIWMGVPLKLEEKIIGLIGIKSYNHRNKYNIKHLEMLDFISGQIAIAIERKRNEEKLNFQNARIKAIFESSSHLMWSVNRKLALSSYNHNYADAIMLFHKTMPVLGAAPESLNKMLSKAEYLNFVLSKYQLAFEGKPQHFETSNTLPNGREIWWEIYLNPISQSDGNVEEVSGIAHDITQKKLAEMALLESEEKFRDIFESFQDIYYRTTLDGDIMMISPSAQELLGFKPEEIIGQKIELFYENPEVNDSLENELLTTGTVKNYEVNMKTKFGTSIQTITNLRLMYNKRNEPIAIEGVARDITSLKIASEELRHAKELAEKSLKSKQLFLANMSHEIRTPMNGVIGMIDLLSNSQLNAEQKEYIDTIKKSSETLLNILNDILDLSKLEAGKMQLKPSPVSIEGTIEKLFALFNNLAQQKNIKLQYSISPDVPMFINADETRFLQILANLTSNAIKFTEKGEISVIVKRAGKKRIKFVVQDTGIGITKENVKLLFSSFSQLDNTTTKAYQGTGLGLSISKELCKLMGGTIGVKSEINMGSTFWFTIEAQPVDKIELAKTVSETEINVFGGFGAVVPKILLVDDNQINQKVASEILKKAGCVVDVATNGMEAIFKVIENPYDLIFMDIQMPEMDGITATKKIRELRIKKLAPIIAMTAYSMEEDKEKFLKAGMDDYLPKPIKSENIVKIIRKWVLNEDEEKINELSDKQLSSFVINPEVVSQLKMHLDDEMVSDVYMEFESETEQLIKACESMNLEIIRSNLHTIKGNAGTLGIDRVAKWAKKMEADIKKKNTSNFGSDFVNLNSAFDEFKKSYKKLLNINTNVNA